MSYQVKVTCTNCGYSGYKEIADGELVTKQYCPVCLCQTLTRESIVEGTRVPLPPNEFIEGIIVKSTWERSVITGDPYIKLIINSKETPSRTLYKNYAIITPLLLPGMIDNLSYLESITHIDIKVPKKLKEGQDIPELVGKEVLMEVEYVEWDFKKFRPHVTKLGEPKV